MRHVLVVVGVVGLLVVAGCAGFTGPDAGSEATPTTAADGSGPATTSIDAPEGTLAVHFINVGQSVATLVVGPTGETMLIDSGDFTDDGEYVLDYLQAHNIDRIDHFVTSHNDADHIGGHAAIIDYYETEADGIGAVYDPGIGASTQTYDAYLDEVEEHDVDLFKTVEGDQIPFEGDSVTVDVLGPPQPYIASEERNENSIVLKLTFGETTFLFPGDAEDDQEAYLVDEYGQQLRADVLKAGHHGSSSSSSGPFLDAVDPAAVIVSSAFDSRYGHPTEEVLQRLADRSLSTYWTGVHGDVVLVSDGSTITVRTQEPATTDPLALRDFPAVGPETDGPVADRARITGGGIDPIGDGATATATDGGTQLAVTDVNADAAGDDRENLNDEYVVLTNQGDQALDLGGWTVSDEADQTYTIPEGVILNPGESVTLHTGSGTDTATDLYWGRGQPVWNNDGDTVIVRDENGDVVTREAY